MNERGVGLVDLALQPRIRVVGDGSNVAAMIERQQIGGHRRHLVVVVVVVGAGLEELQVLVGVEVAGSYRRPVQANAIGQRRDGSFDRGVISLWFRSMRFLAYAVRHGSPARMGEISLLAIW